MLLLQRLKTLLIPKERKRFVDLTGIDTSTIEGRYEWLFSTSCSAWEELANLTDQSSFSYFLENLKSLHYEIRFDEGIPVKTKAEVIEYFLVDGLPARYALNILIPGRNPLSVIVRQMHETKEELLDTLFHESIHATGFDKKRFQKQPSDTSTLEYQLEEITAIHGALTLSKRLGISLGAQQGKSKADLHIISMGIKDRSKIEAAKRRGEIAADFLCEGR